MSAAAPTYYELLRHPEWQKKRLRVMEAAGFACEQCDATEITLNVHHRLYRKGAKPWEYEDREFECLCENCHEERHAIRDHLNGLLALLDTHGLESIVGYVAGRILMCMATPPRQAIDPSTAQVHGLADAWDFRGRFSMTVLIDALARAGWVADPRMLREARRELHEAQEAAGPVPAEVVS